MLIFMVAAGIGAVGGFVLGGRLSGLGRLRLRAPALIWIALALQLAPGLPFLAWMSSVARVALLVVSYSIIGVWMATNAVGQRAVARGALSLLCLGWMLNLMVMVPNGGMPVSAEALDAIGAATDIEVEEGHLWKHVELSESTILPALGDVVAVPVLGSAVSAGDVVMFAGVAVLIAAAMVQPAGANPALARRSRSRIRPVAVAS